MADFEDVQHTGGAITIRRRGSQYQLSYVHMRPVRSTLIELFVKADGTPVCVFAHHGNWSSTGTRTRVHGDVCVGRGRFVRATVPTVWIIFPFGSSVHVALPVLRQGDAQLVLAREYGFPGWKDLLKEVKHRLGRGLEWAVSEARRIIHENDIEGLRQLLAEYPALLSWRADENDGGLLAMATGSFGDSGDPFREEHLTRLACAELLLDAGAVVAPSVCDGLIHSRARRLIDLFQRRGLLPRSLKFLAALGDVDGVRARLDTNADDLAAVNEAFTYACHFEHETVAALLLDRSITLDTELGKRIDDGPGRSAFVQYFIANGPDVNDPDPFRPWQAFVKQQISGAMHDGDLTSFVDGLRREAWLLSDACVKFQVDLIEGTAATLKDRAAFLKALLDLDPAVLHCPVPPPPTIGPPTSRPRAFVHAFTYAQTHLIPMLLRIWPCLTIYHTQRGTGTSLG